jgi:SAM-dependent methyltransferase
MGQQGSRRAIDAAEAVLGLSLRARRTAEGYVDVTGGEERTTVTIAQRLMQSTAVPAIYERWWRPALGRIAKGPAGPSMAGEVALAREVLDLRAGDVVLDVACGPGNFTRAFARDVAPGGAVIGLDLSKTMLERAVRDTDAGNVVYVRGDITSLPLRAATTDAVCCFAALHLFDAPDRALDVMAAALVPGGRLALLTSARPQHPAAAAITDAFGRVSGIAMFDPDNLAEQMVHRGLHVVRQETFGLALLLAATRSHEG